MRSLLIPVPLATVLALACLDRVQAQTVAVTPPPAVVKIESGLTYSRGDYGLAQDTEVLAVPFGLVYESGPWAFRATVPWIKIKGPANVIGDGAASTGGPVRPTSDSESGIGDSTLSVTYKLNPSVSGLNVDLTGRVKLPTGDDARGIGTGEIDTYAQLDLYQTYGSVTPFGSLGYRWLGDGRYQLEDGFYAAGGLLFTLAPGTSVGASIEWRNKLVSGGEDATEASVFLFRRFNERWSGNLSVMKGFTDASANYGLAAQLSYAF
jgi:hypothetical protein